MRHKIRGQRGSLAVLAFIGMMPLLAAIGAIGVDTMHVNSTKGELQKALDAGALAGANELWRYWSDSPNGKSAEASARAVAGTNNPVDGRLIDDADPKMKLSVFVDPPAANGTGGKVTLFGEIEIRGIFSHMFGVNFQTVTAHSQAGPSGTASTAMAGSLFPLVVSIGEIGPDGTTLGSKNLNDTFKLGWKPGSDNVFWTGLENSPPASSASNVDKLMTAYRNPGDSNGHKSVSINDPIDFSNGTQASNISRLAADFVGKTLMLPIIDGTSAPSPVIGWFGLKVTGVLVNGANSEVTGTITNGTIYGTGAPPPPNATWNTFLSQINISPSRLLQ